MIALWKLVLCLLERNKKEDLEDKSMKKETQKCKKKKMRETK